MGKEPTAAEILREIRQRQGKSLREAATELGVNAGHLSRVERGEKGISTQIVARAADYYGLDAELLLLAEGRLPDDVVSIFRENPWLVEELRTRFTGGLR